MDTTEQLNNNTWVKNRAGVPQVACEAGRGPAQQTDMEPAGLFLHTLNPHAPPKGLLGRFGRFYMVCHPGAPSVEDQIPCTPERFLLPRIWHHQELHTGSGRKEGALQIQLRRELCQSQGGRGHCPSTLTRIHRVPQPFSPRKPLVWIEEEPEPKTWTDP